MEKSWFAERMRRQRVPVPPHRSALDPACTAKLGQQVGKASAESWRRVQQENYCPC